MQHCDARLTAAGPGARPRSCRGHQEPDPDRTRALPPKLEPGRQRCLAFAGWKLDTVTRVLTGPDGDFAPPSGAEYRQLRSLLDHPNRLLDRDQLVELI